MINLFMIGHSILQVVKIADTCLKIVSCFYKSVFAAFSILSKPVLTKIFELPGPQNLAFYTAKPNKNHAETTTIPGHILKKIAEAPTYQLCTKPLTVPVSG